ncbi:hypothetical protein BC938DRAFT_483705 [Jimgerdemannia flammicorona]|uniref:Uncharacterized protein n=1 Tax=Jimgerdemannia flammicorona TaxID=994334 RepID=A0A433QBD1_9FUNG|nr:hypothetical protein BC938DRAFT_483705 [Jimgerdemannia flammicorona]
MTNVIGKVWKRNATLTKPNSYAVQDSQKLEKIRSDDPHKPDFAMPFRIKNSIFLKQVKAHSDAWENKQDSVMSLSNLPLVLQKPNAWVDEPDTTMFTNSLNRTQLNAVGVSIKDSQLFEEQGISSDMSAYRDSYHIVPVAGEDGILEFEEHGSKGEVTSWSGSEVEDPILLLDVDVTPELEEHISEVENPILSNDVDVATELEDLVSNAEIAAENVSKVEENKMDFLVEVESSIIPNDVEDSSEPNVDTKGNKFENAETVFYDWLNKPLPDEEKKVKKFVELHKFGNGMASVVEKKQVIMFVPTYLLDDIGWYTDKLGICLYVRRRLTKDQLRKLNKMIQENSTFFHGVEQLVIEDDTTDSEDDEPSDGNNNEPSDGNNNEPSDGNNNEPSDGNNNEPSDGNNDEGQRNNGKRTPNNQSQKSVSGSGNEGGDSGSGAVRPLDLGNLGEGYSLSGVRTGVARRSPNNSGKNEKDGEDCGLSTPEASNSTPSVTGNWRQFLRSFCCCSSGVEIEENLRASNGSEESMTPETIAPSLPTNHSNPIDEACQITVPSLAISTNSSNDGIATAAVLHVSTEGSDPGTSLPEMSNNMTETNVLQGIHAAGSVFYNSRLHIDNYAQRTPFLEVPEAPKFTVVVCTISRAVLPGVEQKFMISFTLKLTVTKCSHKFELESIVLTGGKDHLIKDERYFFKNFLIEIIPYNAEIECRNAKPESKRIGYWVIAQKGDTDGIKWCHKVDKPFKRARVLRHQFEPYMAEYFWDCLGDEPTEYTVNLKAGLTFLETDAKNSWRHTYHGDLVNSASVQIKKIQEHTNVNVRLKANEYIWEVERNAENGVYRSNTKNIPFTNCHDCCNLKARICTSNIEEDGDLGA